MLSALQYRLTNFKPYSHYGKSIKCLQRLHDWGVVDAFDIELEVDYFLQQSVVLRPTDVVVFRPDIIHAGAHMPTCIGQVEQRELHCLESEFDFMKEGPGVRFKDLDPKAVEMSLGIHTYIEVPGRQGGLHPENAISIGNFP